MTSLRILSHTCHHMAGQGHTDTHALPIFLKRLLAIISAYTTPVLLVLSPKLHWYNNGSKHVGGLLETWQPERIHWHCWAMHKMSVD